MDENTKSFLERMEACTSQNDLDTLCKEECLLHHNSKEIQIQVYRKRGEIIKQFGV